MTNAMVNPMVTDAGHKLVACNTLQRREESLDNGQMGETLGGGIILPILYLIAKTAAPYVATGATAVTVGVVLAELTSKDDDKCCSCSCKK